jgi:hypothetical protein
MKEDVFCKKKEKNQTVQEAENGLPAQNRYPE